MAKSKKVANMGFRQKEHLKDAVKYGKVFLQYLFDGWSEVITVGASVKLRAPDGKIFYEKWSEIKDRTFCVEYNYKFRIDDLSGKDLDEAANSIRLARSDDEPDHELRAAIIRLAPRFDNRVLFRRWPVDLKPGPPVDQNQMNQEQDPQE